MMQCVAWHSRIALRCCVCFVFCDFDFFEGSVLLGVFAGQLLEKTIIYELY